MGNYYRSRPSFNFGGFTITPAVKALLLANAILYIVPVLTGFDLQRRLLLFLVPGLVLRGMVWQLFTYMFLHGGFSHILFNCLTLWMFGSAVEQTWGTRRFATYYLSCGLAAGACVTLVALFGGPDALYTPTVGASGAIFGVIVAFGMLFPDAPVLMMFLFPMPAKYFAMLLAGIELLMQLSQPGSGISHVAHLGGAVYGFLYIKFYMNRRPARSSYYDYRPPVQKQSFWSRFDLRGAWQRWKMRRARKKFEVYMRRREENEDRWIN